MSELKSSFNLKKKLRANPTAKKNRPFKGSNQMRLKNIRNKRNQEKLKNLTNTRQRMAIVDAMHTREGPLNSIRYQPEIFENLDKHLNNIQLNPNVSSRMMLEDKQRGSRKRTHKYSKKKRGKSKYGGVKRKRSDSPVGEETSDPDSELMKEQAVRRIQKSIRDRQSRQKSKKTKKNIGERKPIYTSDKKEFQDLNSKEKSEIRRRYREHIKSLEQEDVLKSYLYPNYFRGVEHYTSRPLPLEQIIREENLHNLGLDLDDASAVELLLVLAEIDAEQARRDELAHRAEMAILENIDD